MDQQNVMGVVPGYMGLGLADLCFVCLQSTIVNLEEMYDLENKEYVWLYRVYLKNWIFSFRDVKQCLNRDMS